MLRPAHVRASAEAGCRGGCLRALSQFSDMKAAAAEQSNTPEKQREENERIRWAGCTRCRLQAEHHAAPMCPAIIQRILLRMSLRAVLAWVAAGVSCASHPERPPRLQAALGRRLHAHGFAEREPAQPGTLNLCTALPPAASGLVATPLR